MRVYCDAVIKKILRIIDLVRNMGLRYTAFRAKHELLRRSGLLKSKFPVAPEAKSFISLDEWRNGSSKFFFASREALTILRQPDGVLEANFSNIKAGKLLLFNSVLADLGVNYDWVTNPDNGYRYDVNKHWTEIADYSSQAGDIKYVWEKSRFSCLYDIIRYEYHYGKDCAELVFGDILSWIDSNPINCGPNYRCSQEMSLRVLNWTFALYYYRNSPTLTKEVFQKVQHVIYWHLHHIYHNIQFSRIAVRNNHAITETLTLYLCGLLYPGFPESAKWKVQGKAWFEEEIAYQIYPDGTFLQFSMNYHRVVVQLLTWGIVLAEKNNERFSDVVYERARKSVQFLRTCMVDENGWLPNYGANDGALFFKLSMAHYRDYRPQLQALAAALGMDVGVGAYEDVAWYGIAPAVVSWLPNAGISSFSEGGYYIIREPETLTFIKCGSYKDRPSQADNLHIDIWYKGENVLVDAGSYKYNADAETIRYFGGTRSHNTVMLGGNDQMLKGGRFIWYHWSQAGDVGFTEEADRYVFDGFIKAFSHVGKRIGHSRVVVKTKGQPIWAIQDAIINKPAGMQMEQLWHTPKDATVRIVAKDQHGVVLSPTVQPGWASSLYGAKYQTTELSFATAESFIDTIIEL